MGGEKLRNMVMTRALLGLLLACSTVANEYASRMDIPSRSSLSTKPTIPQWPGTQVRDLWGEYSNIFRHGNRNAASHLWSAFLMARASQMAPQRFEHLSAGYCAVSGSPVTPMDRTRYRLTLQHVAGGTATGVVYYCCWPCVCDTQDFIKVDTKTVLTQDGPKQYRFMVIGNPCAHRDQIPWEAPEVRCSDQGELIGAPMSDHGYVILAMFFDDVGETANDEAIFAPHCEERKQMGYNSGMGEIFRKVAGIAPIQNTTGIGYSPSPGVALG